MATVRAVLNRWRLQPLLPLRYVAATVAAIIALFPFYWMFVVSLQTNKSAFDVVPHFWPDWQWGNYVRAWQAAPWPQYFANSLFIAAISILLTLVVTLLAGYAFGTMRFPGQRLLFLAVLGLIMIPSEATLIPSYLIVAKLPWINLSTTYLPPLNLQTTWQSASTWINSYEVQILPFAVSISGIFLLRQFFLSLPPSLWEAAQLDGCSRFGYLWRVAMPLARPSLAVVALQVFIGSWNAFLWPFLTTNTETFRPVEVGLYAFLGEQGSDPTGLAAAAAFTTLPVMVVFLIAQRQFIAGISAGGLKE